MSHWQLTLRNPRPSEFAALLDHLGNYAERRGLSPATDDDETELILTGPREQLLGVMTLASLEYNSTLVDLRPAVAPET